mgnify:CR=1 FL=1
MTATLTKPRDRNGSPPPAFDLDAAPTVAGRRRLPEIAAGVLVILVFALGALWWQASTTQRTEVLAVRVPVERGHVMTVDDLQLVGIDSDDNLAVLRESDAAGIVGRVARTDLVAGALVTRELFSTSSLIGSGEGVVGLSLLLLAVVFRSIFIPVKAAVMNVLTIAAALGVITWVFQDGHFASLIGVHTTGPIEAFLPVFMFALVFGLSMDYEVFLVTRMHEEWEHHKDAAGAVRNGLALTGKVITAAAIIMIAVFSSFMLGDDRTIKLFGLGLATAVLVDAFLIRLVLVPALMFVAGRVSWWMPGGLARRLPRLSIEGPDTPATK